MALYLGNDLVASSGSNLESGSNANGSWIKFSDGTMIIRQTKIVPSADLTTVDGNMYRGNLGTLPDFPVQFADIPTVSLTVTNAFKTLIAGQEGQATKNRAFDVNGNPEIIGIYSATNKTITNAIVNLVAIGRWK